MRTNRNSCGFLSFSPAIICFALAVILALTAGGCAGVKRMLIVDSTPSGANVIVDQQERGTTRFTTKEPLVWKEKGPESGHTISIEKDGYEGLVKDLGYSEAKTNRNPWAIQVQLQPLVKVLDVKFTTTPAGASVSIGDSEPHKTPATAPVKFVRRSAGVPWSSVQAVIVLENHFPQTVELQYERLSKDPQVFISLDETKRVVPVDIEANVDAATAEVNGVAIGATPLRYNFVFSRPDPQKPWETFLVSVKKEGYHARSEGGAPQPGANPPFSKTLTLEEASKGRLRAELEPTTYIYTTVPSWEFTSKGLRMKEEKILSKMGEIEKEPKVQSVTRITNFKPEDGFVKTRISVMPDSQQIVYAIRLKPTQGDNPTRFFSNIWMQRGNERTRLTDGLQFDVEASVSPDGTTIFFSSDRLGPRFTIWSMQTVGRGGLTKITDSPSAVMDTEAAVSPDGKKIAYTSNIQGAEAPQIWIVRADGTLPTQVRLGEHPAWSPDGKKIAFVAPDSAGKDKIWVMADDGGNPTQLTYGEQYDQYPAWTPDGSAIVYASDQAINEEHEHNFDIWRMNADGTGFTQLTVNGSYDSRPTVSRDGRYIYFLSNRGARMAGENSLQIWRIELRPSGSS